jgi:tetratricopeptide (TPR) repeat protein
MYQRAVRQDPSDIKAQLALADISETHGDFVGAERHVSDALRYAPDNIDARRTHGRLLVKLNKPESAKSEYLQVLEQNSEDVRALNGLGVSLDMLDQHAAAQQAYRSALDAEPTSTMTLNNFAHSYVLVGGYKQAIELLEPTIVDKTSTEPMRKNLAEAYGLSGMYADAERIGLMDSTQAESNTHIAYYRSQREKLGIVPKFSADLGAETTEPVAQSRAEAMKEKYGIDAAGLILTVSPSIAKIGSTPRFDINVTGFENANKLKAFCAKLLKSGTPCKAQVIGHYAD